MNVVTETVLPYVRERHLLLLEKNRLTLGHIIARSSSEQAKSLRDGGDGWTPLEILCHLRDFDEIFLTRAQDMRAQDNPTFTVYDVDGLARERAYNEQSLTEVYAVFSAARARLIAFFEPLTVDELLRTGTHPWYGPFTILQQLIQIGHHDANHIEQMTRVLAGDK